MIAFEPIPSNFKILEQNVALNSLNGTIIPMKNGISASNKILKLPTGLQRTMINADTIENYTGYEKVEFMTLSEVIIKYKPHILKIDCEGCEYELFRNSPSSVLAMLETILGEYHYKGFGELEQIFGDAGFVCNNEKTNHSIRLFVARRRI